MNPFASKFSSFKISKTVKDISGIYNQFAWYKKSKNLKFFYSQN